MRRVCVVVLDWSVAWFWVEVGLGLTRRSLVDEYVDCQVFRFQ